MASEQKIRELRQEIDRVDHQILDLYQRRLKIVRDIAALKIHHGMEADQPQRLGMIRQDRLAYIASLDISEGFLEKMISLFHDDAIFVQERIMSKEKKT